MEADEIVEELLGERDFQIGNYTGPENRKTKSAEEMIESALDSYYKKVEKIGICLPEY